MNEIPARYGLDIQAEASQIGGRLGPSMFVDKMNNMYLAFGGIKDLIQVPGSAIEHPS